jgi:hypothetical protein
VSRIDSSTNYEQGKQCASYLSTKPTTSHIYELGKLILVMKRICSVNLSFFALLVVHSEAFMGTAVKVKPATTLDPSFVPPNYEGAGITEELCIDTCRRMQLVKVPVSSTISVDGEVGISYSYWPSLTRSKVPPVVLIHGFDSSNLEFRRLGSRLAALGVDTYAVDLLGWGYTQLEDVIDFQLLLK